LLVNCNFLSRLVFLTNDAAATTKTSSSLGSLVCVLACPHRSNLILRQLDVSWWSAHSLTAASGRSRRQQQQQTLYRFIPAGNWDSSAGVLFRSYCRRLQRWSCDAVFMTVIGHIITGNFDDERRRASCNLTPCILHVQSTGSSYKHQTQHMWQQVWETKDASDPARVSWLCVLFRIYYIT